MNKYKVFLLIILSISCLVVSISILLWILRPPSNSPCSPIMYPKGNKLNWNPSKIYTFETNASYENVVAFYRSHLQFDPPLKMQGEIVEWNEHSIQKKGILFECGSKLNSYEVELGCVFIHEKQNTATVDILWSYAEGAPTPCYFLPEVEPEDYLASP